MTPEAFRRLRRDLNLHQREVAALLGVQLETVNRWERGRSPMPLMAGLALEHIAAQEGLTADARTATYQPPADWTPQPVTLLEHAIAASAEPNPPPMVPPLDEYPDRPGMPEALEEALGAVTEAGTIAGTYVRVPLPEWSALLDATTQYYKSR